MEQKQYRVCTMAGYYPINSQENWLNTFDSMDTAIMAAVSQHLHLDPLTSGEEILTDENQQIYTFITDDVDAMNVVWLFYEGKEYKDVEAQVLADMLGEEG